MPTTKQHNYDEDKIKSLSSLEHIRKRTGMYIGRIGDGSDYDDGIYILLKEIVDNAIDEFIMGYGERIAITLEGPALRCEISGAAFRWAKSSSAFRESIPAPSTVMRSSNSASD